MALDRTHGPRALARVPPLDPAWRRSGRTAAIALLLSRAVVWISGVLAMVLLGSSGDAATFDPAGLTDPFSPLGDLLVAPAARWDAVWFLAVATDGYSGDRTAFFPLYPLLVRAAGFATGSPLLGAIAISMGCAFAALTVLHRLVALDFGEDAARLCVALVAWFPAAFFLSAVYSEALFLALSVGAVYAARTGRWAWAGTLGALAASTRSAGVLLLVPLGLLYLQARGRPRADALWLAVVPLGLGAFCAGLALDGQDPWAPFTAQEAWLRTFAGPLGAVPAAVEAALHDTDDLVLLGWLVAAAVAVVGALRRLPAAYAVYAAAALLLPLSFPVPPEPLMSLPRFLLVLWPLHLWAALVLVRRSRRVQVAVLAVSGAGMALLAASFSTWHWVA